MSDKQQQDKWISVEQMPDKTGLYKVKVLNDYEAEAFLSRTAGGKLVWVVNHPENITHYQPLPSPPKK